MNGSYCNSTIKASGGASVGASMKAYYNWNRAPRNARPIPGFASQPGPREAHVTWETGAAPALRDGPLPTRL
ncbi:hypothetical protein SKAU_G00051990 [Synaphobranchus kaupii]|uniref:Uncharacterized protein n=1 Tax=Synaphobranchus kaupii TaxID=118154 RepID=A0A9Q1G480_SYNKA|nr:hypothetical protein SKAU_G00051990 [Synaphobranchus kaupii]